MVDALKRIKRCILMGQVRFTFKAELEMLTDQLSRTDILESIMNAQGITKVLRSRGAAAKSSGERLYVIHGFTFDKILI